MRYFSWVSESRSAMPATTGALKRRAKKPMDLYVEASRPKKGTNMPLPPAFWSATNPSRAPSCKSSCMRSPLPHFTMIWVPEASRSRRSQRSMYWLSMGRARAWTGKSIMASQ